MRLGFCAQTSRADTSPSAAGHFCHSTQLLANKNAFQRHGGLGALVRCDIGVQVGHKFGRERWFILHIRKTLQSLGDRCNFGLQSLCHSKISEQTFIQGNLFDLVNDRLGFFIGD